MTAIQVHPVPTTLTLPNDHHEGRGDRAAGTASLLDGYVRHLFYYLRQISLLSCISHEV